MVFYPQPPRAGLAPAKKFLRAPSKGRTGKNLGPGLEEFISTNNDTTEKDRNIRNTVGPR